MGSTQTLVTVGGMTEVVVDGALDDVAVVGAAVVQITTGVGATVGLFLGGY